MQSSHNQMKTTYSEITKQQTTHKTHSHEWIIALIGAHQDALPKPEQEALKPSRPQERSSVSGKEARRGDSFHLKCALAEPPNLVAPGVQESEGLA